jgi:uncharacterized membrane protein
MEHNSYNTKSENSLNFSLKYGLLLAATLFVIHIINYLTNFEFGFISYLNHIAIIAIIVLGAVTYKRNFLNGFISYGKALSITIMISISGLLVYSALLFLFLKFFDAVILDILQRKAMEKIIENPQISNAQLDQIESTMRFMFTPLLFSLSNFLSLVFYSTFYSLISSAFIKKKDSSFDANFKKYKNEYFDNNSSV